jgi:hypothetical protein
MTQLPAIVANSIVARRGGHGARKSWAQFGVMYRDSTVQVICGRLSHSCDFMSKSKTFVGMDQKGL